jgi:hypothetical protein
VVYGFEEVFVRGEAQGSLFSREGADAGQGGFVRARQLFTDILDEPLQAVLGLGLIDAQLFGEGFEERRCHASGKATKFKGNNVGRCSQFGREDDRVAGGFDDELSVRLFFELARLVCDAKRTQARDLYFLAVGELVLYDLGECCCDVVYGGGSHAFQRGC